MTTAEEKKLSKGARTRHRILEATFQLLAEGGLEAFSAANLSRQAAISKATLFHHFDSLDDILFATAMSLLEQFEQAFESQSWSTPNEYLVAMGRAAEASHMMEYSGMARAQAAFFVKAASDERFRSLFEGMILDYRDRIASDLAALTGLPRDNASLNAIAYQAMALGDGMGMHALFFKKPGEFFMNAWNAFAETSSRVLQDEKRRTP